MEIAYNEAAKTHLSVEGYIAQFGPKPNEKGELRKRAAMIRYACKGDVHLHAEASGPIRDVVWSHNADPGRWCPIKKAGVGKYELLVPKRLDPAAATRLRNSVLSNWKAHWGFIPGRPENLGL